MLKRTTLAALIVAVSTAASAQDTLRFGHYFTVEDFRGKTAQFFADRVDELTDDINVEVYPNESLVKGREALQATAQGVVDIYSVYAGYISGQVPIVNVFSLPFPPQSYDDDAMYELALDPQTVEILDAQFARFGVKYLGVINSTGPSQMFLRKPIEKVEDIAGLKLRGSGGLGDEALRELGASLVLLSAAEQFLALQTGTVDGITTTWSSYVNFNLSDVAPTYVAATVVRGPYLLLMNQAKWARLSDGQQTVIEQAVKDTVAWSQDNFEAEQNELHDKVVSSATTVVEVSAEEETALRDKLKSIYTGYVDSNGESGAKLMTLWNNVTGTK